MVQFFRRVLNLLGFLVLLGCTVQGAGLKLKWQPNAEADLAGYRVHIGQQSRTYTKSINVGDTTATLISDLADNTTYYFSVTAYDHTGNESLYANEISVTLGDTRPPTLASITVISKNELLLVFSEAVEENSSQDVSHYKIVPAVTVTSAQLQSDKKTVLIKTAEHQAGVDYTLVVNGVTDRALTGNAIAADSKLSYRLGVEDADTTPPVLQMASLVSATQLQLYFNEPLDPASATATSHYAIRDITVEAAVLSADGSMVQLTTSRHTAGSVYTVTVNDVTDRSARKNKIQANSTYTYTYDPGDVTGPVITLVNATAVNQIEVMFNEPVDESSAETLSHYSINNGISILSAELDGSGQVLRLQTSAHQANQVYVFSAEAVVDRSANHNAMAGKNTASYVYAPADQVGPTITRVVMKDFTHLLVTFNEAVDATSAEEETHYVINNSIQVFSANLDGDGKSVELLTSPHVSGQIYTLLISKVKDTASPGNEIIANSSYAYVYGVTEPNTGPTIAEVQVLSANRLQVSFNKPVEKNSAQSASNYVLNRGAAVTSATLDASATRVTLQTSTHEPNKIYIISVSNIIDAGGNRNMILPNSSYSYVYEGVDQTGPVITLVKVVDSEHLDILFNERLALEGAATLSSYTLNAGLEVKAAELDASRRIVHLTTSSHHSQTVYVLRINGLKDEAAGNAILANTSYTYVYEPADALPPTLAMVRVKDAQHVEVVFSENVEQVTALDITHYTLNGGEVHSAKKGSAGHLVELEVTALQTGKIHLLVVNDVCDVSGNRIHANSSYAFTFGDLTVEQVPAVIDVYAAAAAELYLTFNMKVNKAQAETIANYTLQGGTTITSAKLDGSMTQLKLQTSAHLDGRIYSVMINNISRWDRPDLICKTNTPFFYTMQPDSKAPPKLEKVAIEGENLVRLTFSATLEKSSAENKRNYLISDNLTVLSAELQSDAMQILLETARHQSGKAYTITVAGVKGYASATAMTSAVLAYTYMPSLEIKIDGLAEAMLSYADVGRPYYVDRNYVLTTVPEDLVRAKLVMTANNDRTQADSRFLIVQLSKSALVYVAYDDRATSVPNWLDANFVKSDRYLGTSESGNRLRLWQGYFPAGRVIMGGNAAVGSRGSQMMYVVLIQEGDFGSTAAGGYTEGSALGRKIPETVNLLSNYPNPFNPRTTIRFELPYEQEVQVMVYDLLGRRVRMLYHAHAAAGQHSVLWDGTNEEGVPVAAGVYLYRLDSWENGQRNGLSYKENYITKTGKMTLLK